MPYEETFTLSNRDPDGHAVSRILPTFANLTLCSEATESQLNTIQVGMKKPIFLLAMLGLFAACEQKTTTVNPPDKKESNTTIVNPPGSSTTTTKEEKKTDINVNTSPNP
jgi:hypothetical protein